MKNEQKKGRRIVRREKKKTHTSVKVSQYPAQSL